MSFYSSCDSLHGLLSGALGPEYISDLYLARQHWSTCDRCQGLLPQAVNYLNFIEAELLRRAHVNIEQLYHRYRSAEHNLLAKRDSENLLPLSCTINFLERKALTWEDFPHDRMARSAEPEENTQRLLVLAEAGKAVQAHLQVMNDTWGLDSFHLLHEYPEWSSTKFGSFVASMPHDIQLFIFQSILAMDSIEDCEPEAVTQPAFKSSSSQMGSRLYTLVVKAAPEFCKEFVDCIMPSSTVDSEVLGAEDRDRLLRICDNLEKHLDDVADSLKAGQMEMIRRWDRFGTRASDMEPFIEVTLGPLYARLANGTKRDLQLAEFYYSHNPEPDDFKPAITSFHAAFEGEFKLRLLAPLEARLQREKMTDYPPDKPIKLMVRGRLNRNLTLGQALHFIHNDPIVSKFVTELGLDVEKIYRGSSELNDVRNDAIHEAGHTRANAERVRSILLGQPSILAHLFKEAVV